MKKTFLTSVTVLATSLAIEASASIPETLAQSLGQVATYPDQKGLKEFDQTSSFVLEHAGISDNTTLAAHRSHSSHSSHSSHYSGSSGGGYYSPPASTPSYSPSYKTPSYTPSYRDSSSYQYRTSPPASEIGTQKPATTKPLPNTPDISSDPSYMTNPSTNLVIRVQMALYKAGFGLAKFDGVMDASTKQALSDFQISKQLSATGELTKETLDALGITP